MRVVRALRAATALIAVPALLAACGSGVELRLFVSFNAPPARIDRSTVVLGGIAALPAGSVRTGGTLGRPYVTCRPGTFSMTWTNDANGTRGAISALWDCPADQLNWSSSPIPLVQGANRITVTMVDAIGSASSAVVVTRE